MSDSLIYAPRERAVRLADRRLQFNRLPKSLAQTAGIVVAISLHNQGAELRAAVMSVLEQYAGAEQVAILVLDDESTDNWRECMGELLEHPQVALAQGCCGSAAHGRNALLDLVDEAFPRARWVARLDADDRLATKNSLRSLVEAGDRNGVDFVIGSNFLCQGHEIIGSLNRADPDVLFNRERLTSYISAFCTGKAEHELPSCNLLLRVRSGIRYPLMHSAEDHWLVAGLLIFSPDRGCVVSEPAYAIYSLGGQTTLLNHVDSTWEQSRIRLGNAARLWRDVLNSGKRVLGWGNEGIVWEQEQERCKCFYPGAAEGHLFAIQQLVANTRGAITPFEIQSSSRDQIVITMPKIPLIEIPERLAQETLRAFLATVHDAEVVPGNIKRDNLRLDERGRLIYIDIGRDIHPLTVSRFLDCAARLYAIAILGWSDFELARRRTWRTALEGFSALDGFAKFYGELIAGLHPACALAKPINLVRYHHDDVTLLIKSCPQDAAMLAAQVRHIVGGLRGSNRFARCILLIDSYQGPYLRQYTAGDLVRLLNVAAALKGEGWLDEVWIAPTTSGEVAALYGRWFGNTDVCFSHTVEGAPLFSQLWAFEQIETRFVLQMDVDVLVGLADAGHDVIGEMKRPFDTSAVWCAGFNIPKANSDFLAYASDKGGFAPEVRMGLLDLPRILALRPYENPALQERPVLMWHRALERAQQHNGMQSVRGGDPRSFYIHPRNEDKYWPKLAMVRDLVGQGWYPPEQAEKWDLDVSAPWQYPTRDEDLVFLLLGRDTPPERLSRCIRSLAMQTWQEFGIIVIEDAGSRGATMPLHHWFGEMRARTTIIRRPERAGYIKNFQFAVHDICTRPESLIVVLDQDDALMRVDVAARLWRAWRDGADLVNAPMFRPDKPLALYPVCYSQPRRHGGGNVWAHLRGFRKCLFERIPEWALTPPKGVDCLSDYLTMVPLAEMAERPVALEDAYYYLHDRSPYSASRKQREAELKLWLFTQPALSGE